MNAKARETIIKRYGSWEAYLEFRKKPENAEKRRKAAAKGGAATPNDKRGFSNPEVRQKAYDARWGK